MDFFLPLGEQLFLFLIDDGLETALLLRVELAVNHELVGAGLDSCTSFFE